MSAGAEVKVLCVFSVYMLLKKEKKKVPNMVAYFSEKTHPTKKNHQGGVWEGLERKENTKTDRRTFLLSGKKNDRKGGREGGERSCQIDRERQEERETLQMTRTLTHQSSFVA